MHHMTRIVSSAIFSSVLGFASFAQAARSCTDVFASALDPALVSLYEAVQKPAGDTRFFKHEIEFHEGHAQLKIGFLSAGDRAFSRAFYVATKKGLVSGIEAGDVVGPKVLELLLSISQLSKGVNVTGFFELSSVRKDIENYRTQHVASVVEGKTDHFFMSASDVERFNQNVKALRIEEACRRFYGADLAACGRMKFSFRSGDVEGIVWDGVR